MQRLRESGISSADRVTLNYYDSAHPAYVVGEACPLSVIRCQYAWKCG
jgi:hypothetical protein